VNFLEENEEEKKKIGSEEKESDKRKKEIEMLKSWCEEKIKEYNRTPIILLNPFRDIDWLRNKIYIKIDAYLGEGKENTIVYDPTTKSIYEFINGVWKKIGR
jgi:hypothetical protein